MKKKLLKSTAILLGMIVCGCINANAFAFHTPVPEIDPGIAVSACTLLAGSLAVLCARRKK